MDTGRPSHDKNATDDSNTTSTTQEAHIHYPSGIILVLIVSGLLLSMFLVALDMVSSNILSFDIVVMKRACWMVTDETIHEEHHCYGDSTDHL